MPSASTQNTAMQSSTTQQRLQTNPIVEQGIIAVSKNKWRFSKSLCDRLFAAVLVHDDFYPNAQLPNSIHTNYSPEQLTQCYQICRQIWKQEVKRKALVRIIIKLRRQKSLNDEDQTTFKHIRAKFKHLRFAYVTCSNRHRYPVKFHLITIFLGALQDGFKNKKKKLMRWSSRLLGVFLTKLVYSLIKRETKRIKPSSSQSFTKHIRKEINFLCVNLAKAQVTSHEFHEMRIVISRQVAFYDNLKTLYPSAYHKNISEYLSTINGMMGSLHDKLIERRFAKTQDYYSDKFEIPQDIRERLQALTHSYSN